MFRNYLKSALRFLKQNKVFCGYKFAGIIDCPGWFAGSGNCATDSELVKLAGGYEESG